MSETVHVYQDCVLTHSGYVARLLLPFRLLSLRRITAVAGLVGLASPGSSETTWHAVEVTWTRALVSLLV